MKIILGLFLCLVFNSSVSSQSRRIENSSVITQYQGSLESGKSYRAIMKFDKYFALSPVIPVTLPRHYAVNIEWTNLKSFPKLTKLQSNATKQIVFKVISNESKQMTANRWNMTIRCQIIRVE